MDGILGFPCLCDALLLDHPLLLFFFPPGEPVSLPALLACSCFLEITKVDVHDAIVGMGGASVLFLSHKSSFQADSAIITPTE